MMMRMVLCNVERRHSSMAVRKTICTVPRADGGILASLELMEAKYGKEAETNTPTMMRRSLYYNGENEL